MTFFRCVVVELDGAERGTLDVAPYALQPVEDAARVYLLAARKVEVTHTLERLKCALGKEAVLEEAAEACGSRRCNPPPLDSGSVETPRSTLRSLPAMTSAC